MSATPTINIYESTFAKSDKTDAILVVGEKKMHVNRALLSYHSDYFKTLFDTDSAEKSPPEFPIPDVNFEQFATVLSLVQNNPIKNNEYDLEKSLELTERFQLSAAKRYLEFQLIFTSSKPKKSKIEIADKFKLYELFNHTPLDSKRGYSDLNYTSNCSRKTYSPCYTFFKSLSNESNVKLFHQLITIMDGSCEESAKYELENNYESAFAQSDKTDAILAVGEKKLHVNKALLSYHSDYFDTLFNSEFKEKLMTEIPIEDVKFEDFRALLSLVHHNPIFPTESNAENLLELADRFLMLPSVERTLEQFLISTKIDSPNKLRIADKYKLDDLLTKAIDSFYDFSKCNNLTKLPFYQSISDETKTKTSEIQAVFESTFAQSDKSDAILVVEGKKLHVNKAFLSYHSDYSEFTVEFPILRLEDHNHPDREVKYFATVLSLVQDNPIKINEGDDFTVLLKLAEHFQLSQAKRVLELALIKSSKGKHEKIELADKYKLDELFNNTLSMFDEKSDFIRHCNILRCHEGHLPFFETLSVEANVKLFYKLIEVCRGY